MPDGCHVYPQLVGPAGNRFKLDAAGNQARFAVKIGGFNG
jgi:hypothetical protein